MKQPFLLFVLWTASFTLGSAQSIKLQDITNGLYYAENVYGVNPLNDGESYSQLVDGRRIVRSSFKTGEVLDTLFDVANARGPVKLRGITGYILSPNESRMLIETETQYIYRHSKVATYYIYDIENRKFEPLSANGQQQAPKFSPDGNMVAFARGGNLFVVKLLFGNAETQVTKDGERGKVLNGIPDWVNEEEFSTSHSFDFSANSEMLAWVRYDESEVPMWDMTMYKGLAPALSQYEAYPGKYSYKYPVAGQKNADVKVMVHNIKTHTTRALKLPLDADGYVPRIQFTSDPEKLAVVTLNRRQNQMDIYMADSRSTECKLAVRETSETYVNELAYTGLRFYDGHFAMISDRSGYNHIYWYDLNGGLKRQVTNGAFDVTNFYGFDAKTGTFYYASTQESPLKKAVYSTTLKGKTKKLSEQSGTNNATFSKTMKYFLNVYSSTQQPPITTLCNNSGKTLKTVIDNGELVERLKGKLGQKEFFTFETGEGVQLNGWMIKPADFDANKKHPVIMYQYSGPGSQEVTDSWNMGFYGGGALESYWASLGFIVVCVDGRGTGNRGADFKKCTYLRLGELESKDQVETAIWLGEQTYVDKDNIAIWGWSFGGFNTLMSMSEGRKVFKAGVAVAAPSSWRYYDTVYTERFMRTPQENADGYDINAINRAADLHGNLLLIHGTADDNVHLRNALEYSEALVQANKQFDMQIYTNRNHNIYGGNTRHHLFRRITDFFVEHLK